MLHLKERLQPAPLVKFFFAVSSASQERRLEAEALLEKEVGSLELCSKAFCFSDFSKYYDSEFGSQTWKYFLAVKELAPADRLISIKLFAERIQLELCRKGEEWLRTVNLDPGYINGWQVVLSTVKNQSHRIYLGSGVFAEVTLLYSKRGFIAFPWTYQDYQSPLQQEYFMRLRARYTEQIGEDVGCE